MSKGTVRTLFLDFAELHEDYYQASFQTRSDESISADHTFKHARVVQVSGREGKAFGASYTAASKIGFNVINRLTFTKSNSEIDPIIAKYKESRDNAGAGPLKSFQSDNLNGDGGAWMKHFADELGDGVTPFIKLVDPNLPLADIKDDEYTFIATKTAADTWAMAVLNRLNEGTGSDGDSRRLLAGVDLEWGESETCLLQVSIPSFPVGVFHLTAMGVDSPESFPRALKELLELPNLCACGVQTGGDHSRLVALGVAIKSRIELRQLAMAHDDDQANGTSLEALCRRYLKMNVDKSGQHADYSQVPLPLKLVKYGALDAKLHRLLAEILMQLVVAKGPTEAMLEGPSINNLSIGMDVIVLVSSRKVAQAKIVFVGGVKGEHRDFGKETIGIGKAIVLLTDVYEGNAKPPFKKSQPSWPKDVTLQWIYDNDGSREIAVRTSNLLIPVPDSQANHQSSQEEAPVSDRAETETQSQGAAGNGNVADDEFADPEWDPVFDDFVRNFDENAIQENGEEVGDADKNDESIRSRQLEDCWHQFDAIPLTQKCEIRGPVLRLCMHGTFQFVEEDYAPMVKYLTTTKGIRNDDILDHFYFNREFWRKRVRMPTYSPDLHYSNIRKIHDWVRTNEYAKKYYSSDLRKWFEGFEDRARSGWFANIHDVSFFRRVGVDSAGFDLWIRMKGSCRNELIHQKMSVAMGPWGVGAAVAHHLLLLVAYKFNVSTGIRRNFENDFGHMHLQLIDQIQIAIQEIYNVLVYPRHFNVTLFQPVKDFVAVGIGPLTSFSPFVKTGPPMAHLRGDMLFMAERMKVECPPLPPAGKIELKMINDAFISNPKQNDASLKEICAMFQEKTDGKDVFPKLLCQMKVQFKQWEKTSLVKRVIKQMNLGGYTTLLRDLASRQTAEGSLVRFEDSQVNAIPDNPLLRIDDAEPLQFHQYVPPLVAPLQRFPIPLPSGTTPTVQQVRKCYYYPACTCTVDVCGGINQNSCRQVNQGKVTPPSKDELAEQKRKRRNEERAERQRQKKRTKDSAVV